MSGRQLEDLATNNMALRFVTRIATERARELAEQGQKEQANFITQKYIVLFCLSQHTICMKQYFLHSRSKSSVAVLSPLGKCNQMWCSQCSVFSTAACRQKKHKLIDSIQVLSEKMGEVEAKVSECFSMWDTAIKVRQRVRQYYDDVLKSLQLVQVCFMLFMLSLK